MKLLKQLVEKIVVVILNKLSLHEWFVNTVIHHSKFFAKIILNNEFINKTISDNNLLERIILDNAFINKIATSDNFLEKIIHNNAFIEKIAASDDFLKKIVLDDSAYEKVLETVEFTESIRNLRPLISSDKINSMLPRNFITSPLKKNKNIINDRLLDVFCDKEEAFLAHGTMKFTSRYDIWTLINEILIDEDYYFETDTDSPRILDCGTNFGMAIYYFKNLFPKAKVTGFEPFPEMRKLALLNIENNNFLDVEVLPYALAETEKTAEFIVPVADSMAGSLTERRLKTGESTYSVKVQCKRLSEYLQEPVHYLKLDIEGLEDVVLNEAKNFLGNVQYIFCEYHHGLGLREKRLANILSLLNSAGFSVHVSKSWWAYNSTVKRPMNYVANPYSAVLWAKNKNWETKETEQL
jgi:FkbM family methyltransferase